MMYCNRCESPLGPEPDYRCYTCEARGHRKPPEKKQTKKLAPSDAPLNWTTSAQFSCTAIRGEERLGVVVQLLIDNWQVLAITTPLSSNSPKEVFDNHSHKIVGAYASPIEAIEAGESFVRAWLRHFKATDSEPCECDEMVEGARGACECDEMVEGARGGGKASTRAD